MSESQHNCSLGLTWGVLVHSELGMQASPGIRAQESLGFPEAGALSAAWKDYHTWISGNALCVPLWTQALVSFSFHV